MAKPKVIEVDNTIRSLKEFRTLNGQNYITISAKDGQKLMQRLKKTSSGPIDRVLASGQDDEQQQDEIPEIILIESKDYAKNKSFSKGTDTNRRIFFLNKLLSFLPYNFVGQFVVRVFYINN